MNREQWIAAARPLLGHFKYDEESWRKAKVLLDAGEKLIRPGYPPTTFMGCPITGWGIPHVAIWLLSEFDKSELLKLENISTELDCKAIGHLAHEYGRHLERLAVADRAVAKHKKKSGDRKPCKTQRLTAAEKKRIGELYASDESITEIARKLKRHRNTISNYVNGPKFCT